MGARQSLLHGSCGRNRDVDEDGGRMSAVGLPRGLGRIMYSPGIVISSSRKIALEIAIKGWFISDDDMLRGG